MKKQFSTIFAKEQYNGNSFHGFTKQLNTRVRIQTSFNRMRLSFFFVALAISMIDDLANQSCPELGPSILLFDIK